MAITLKNEHDIAQMRVACRLASEVLDYITPHVDEQEKQDIMNLFRGH